MAMLPGESIAQYNARMMDETHAAWRRAVPPIGSGKMPSTSQMIVSKYISHADVETPLVVTIKTCTLENVGRRDEDPDEKWFLWFNEHPKGMRLNVTTIRILEAAFGTHTDQWVGRKIKLYWDPAIMFAGKPVGGVRVRLPTNAAPAGATVAVPAGAKFDPMTGKPLSPPVEAQQARFDPMTGQPLAQAAAAPSAAAAGMQPNPGYVKDPDFDDDIPF